MIEREKEGRRQAKGQRGRQKGRVDRETDKPTTTACHMPRAVNLFTRRN